MSTNTLIEKINADAAAQVAAIQAAAAEEVVLIQQETDTRIAHMNEEAAVLLAKKQAQQELVATSKAKQAGKIVVQQAKREAVDAVFAAAYTKMVSAESDSYIALFTAQAKQVIPTGVANVSVTAPVNRLAETKRILAALSVDAEVVGDAAIDAGLVVTTADGVYDVTLRRIFELKRPVLEMEIVATIIK